MLSFQTEPAPARRDRGLLEKPVRGETFQGDFHTESIEGFVSLRQGGTAPAAPDAAWVGRPGAGPRVDDERRTRPQAAFAALASSMMAIAGASGRFAISRLPSARTQIADPT